MEIIEMFKSKLCWIVMIVGILLSLYIVKPFSGSNADPITAAGVILFIILFPSSLACNIRLLKTRAAEFKSAGKHGIMNFILYFVGITSLQTCLVSGFCGVSGGLSLLFLVLPASIAHAFMQYSKYILLAADAGMFASLLSMKCFSGRKGGKEKPMLVMESKKAF